MAKALEKGLLPATANEDPHVKDQIRWLARYGSEQPYVDSVDQVVRFILSLDKNPLSAPHNLVSRLYAAAQRAKAYADRMRGMQR